MNTKQDELTQLKIKPIPQEQPAIGIDTTKTILDNIIGAAEVGSLDLSALNTLTQTAQTREQAYRLIDVMAEDDVISAVLDTYAEDVVQTNDKGEAIWVEASDSRVLDFTSWLLDALSINKHLYQWVYCLITYGDVYVRLYRKSDMEKDNIFADTAAQKRADQLNEAKNPKEPIEEEAKVNIYADTDKYIPYVEMVSNPSEMFDLQRFGKTYGYIKAPTQVLQEPKFDSMYSYLRRYEIHSRDVEIYDATTFVHGCIENTTQRQPETVDIYLDNQNKDPNNIYQTTEATSATSYTVKRGQSILYNSFRIWRELNLLEMSALLNRLTKSSVVRILNIDVGDMPKEQVQNFLQRLKEKIEQKSALNVGEGIEEYTNPSPIENTIYVPTHGGQGQITPTTIGGDFDPKSLIDVEYFRDKLFGSLKIPKQFFGFTEDGAGFNGGTSLSILSSRYGKSIKNYQHVICQVVTDILNLFLIDRGYCNYINQFTVRMQEPVTQEELDRRANTDNRIRYVSDLMAQLGEIDDKVIKMKIYKSLISPVVNDVEVISYLQEYIDKLEEEAQKENESGNANESEESLTAGDDFDSSDDSSFQNFDFGGNGESPNLASSADIGMENAPEAAEFPPEESLQKDAEQMNLKPILEDESDDDSYLPSPAELNIDLTANERK